MQDIRSVRFACLLVCQSAIFIVNKGDGSGAAPLVDYVCSCCPYIFSGSAEWDKSNPAFADWRDSATKYCDRCMVRKMTDFYNALDEHEFSEGMPEYQAIVNY